MHASRKNRAPCGARFIDVVAHVHHEVELLREHVAIGGIEAGLEVLARGECEPHARHGLIPGWEGARTAKATARAKRLELIPVPGVRPQAEECHVQRMTGLGKCDADARMNDL